MIGDKYKFMEYCINRHDVEVNQKYDTYIPYSMHLRYVHATFKRFSYLLHPMDVDDAFMGCWGHDLIEDTRVTYNDIVDKAGKRVADIIYKCTEEKGRDRDERHSGKYYTELAEDEVAIFVKLCDIIANVSYSVLTNSSMYKKHKKEHDKTVHFLYITRFKPMFEHLDKLFSIA